VKNGNLVIDVDAHYLESVSELAEYMDEPWRTRVKNADASRLLPSSLGDRLVGGRIRRHDVPYGKGDMAPEQVPVMMENLGIDAAIVLANRTTLLGHLSVRDLAVQFCKAYIDYMLDKVVDPSKGIYTMPIVPWQDPEEGAKIIEKVAGNAAVVGVCIMSSGANPPLGDVHYNPIYEAAERHNLPIVYHSDPALTLTEGASYADGLQRLVEAHSLGFLISNQIQLTSVIMQGLPERFPKLKFMFQESGLFYVPMMMYRLDEYYLKRRSEAPLLRALPSEYILDRFYFGTQPIEAPKNPKYLESIFEMANGKRNFCFASDYPHFDYDDATAILKLPFLNPQEKADVLAGNAMKFFDFRKAGVQPWESMSLQK
jgi:predicted TIM-barrel fold metal-dependent hydrolase